MKTVSPESAGHFIRGTAIPSFALIAAFAFFAPVGAALGQAPAIQTGFDGKYTGTKTLTSGNGSGCPNTAVLEMTVSTPQVSIRDQFCQIPFAGTVDVAGRVSASGTCENVGVTISGTISNKSFNGEFAAGHYCSFKVQLIRP